MKYHEQSITVLNAILGIINSTYYTTNTIYY